jgi:hypothetical protein
MRFRARKSRSEMTKAWAVRWIPTGAAALVVLVLHVFSVIANLQRGASFDEAEHLHASWLMSEDQEIYRDFAEDHAPFLPALLELLLPSEGSAEFPLLDVPRFLTRGRVLMAVFGSLAVVAAGLVAFRVSASRVAFLVVLASLLGAERTFLNGIAYVRNDPPTLFLFWVGTFLLVKRSPTRRGAWSVGLGLGLVGVAALWNPKWPFVTLALLVYVGHWLVAQRSIRQVAWTLGAAFVVVAAALFSLLHFTTAHDFVFFTLTYNLELSSWFARSTKVGHWFPNETAFHYCSSSFHWYWAAPAWLVAVAAFAAPRVRRTLPHAPAWALVILLAPAALLEMVLVFPWPRLWPQYYLLWSFSVAILFGCAPAALAHVLTTRLPERLSQAIRVTTSSVAAIVAVGVYVMAWQELRKPPPTSYFRDVAWIQQRLRPGETVWLQPHEAHPIAAFDASYYWYAFVDLVPFSLEYRKTHAHNQLPKLEAADLPPCRVAARVDRKLRFLSEEAGELARPCLERLRREGRLRETPVRGVLAVLEAKPEAPDDP